MPTAKPPAKGSAKVKAPAKTTRRAVKPATAAKPTETAAAQQKPAKPLPGAKTQSITPKVERFILEYLIDPNGSQAYKLSHPGVTDQTARVEAARLLANPRVRARLAEERQKSADKLEITREKLLKRLWAIFSADPRELMEFRVTCCRHCFGVGHAYQWVDEAEFADACARAEHEFEKALKARKPGDPPPRPTMLSDAGGYGFDPTLSPVDECERCAGQGVGRTVIKDTRFLSPQAAALFAGVKETKEGLQILTHSPLDAAEKLAKHLGFYEQDNEQKGKGVGQMLAEFAAGLHARQAGRLPIAAPTSTGGAKSPLAGMKAAKWK
ncbi:terminase small subunit [Paucibacter sp. O1-1]|nr:terminase small subunit [Paucibacter sp. O1-1]MDA3827838.1 terminase small subunit [Paucibacter sp. O1-1]